MEQGETFQGEFIEAGNIISAEFATYEGAKAITTEMPSEYSLAQNYPNPFNPVTNINFSLKQAGDYTLTVYNVTGQVVETFDGSAQAGVTTVTWDASNQASGIYFYKLEVNNFSETKKMVLLK
jgi:flagellar hook assembly protein FlgD